MAKQTVRVDINASEYRLVMPVIPKVRDEQTGEIAKDRQTGEAMYIAHLAETSEGRAQLVKVTIPETGQAEGLKPGDLVRPVELTASPWANVFGDQVNSGLAYRAKGLEAA